MQINYYYYYYYYYTCIITIKYRSGWHTVGSVMSSRSAACSSVLTRASTPPIWQTKLLLTWLLHVRFDKIPATHVTILMSDEVNSWTSWISSPSIPSCNTNKTLDLCAWKLTINTVIVTGINGYFSVTYTDAISLSSLTAIAFMNTFVYYHSPKFKSGTIYGTQKIQYNKY